jgi:hypothetical protein
LYEVTPQSPANAESGVAKNAANVNKTERIRMIESPQSIKNQRIHSRSFEK